MDGFRTQLLPMVDHDINKITVYTMNMQAENDDNCFQIYRKSLLYLVSQIFEPEDDAPILGLEQSIRGDPELMVAFGLTPGHAGSGGGDLVADRSRTRRRIAAAARPRTVVSTTTRTP